MQDKQIYIADTNHETILLSVYEKEIISTKLFNRLHYISQNSTAYLTFPSNRTKRFEHSIGTMKLCGDIFYNAICNASNDIIKKILSETETIIIEKIVKKEILENKDKYILILEDSSLENNGEKLKKLHEYDVNNIFYNRCIPNNIKKEQKYLYLIIFQAIRLCGLLHDVGHPPFSHITEASMNSIYLSLKNKDENKMTENEKIYFQVISKYDDDVKNFQLHEKMGNKMVQYLISQILFSSGTSYINLDFKEKYFKLIVFKLVDLIFQEEGILKLFHSIIAGAVDGDRLDYVNRDIKNSGINNGRIEYDRLISSCKFSNIDVKGDNKIVITYDIKTINTIEDFFMKRWYLYKNVINHHRVSKTDFLLQKCLEIIIKNYLKSSVQEQRDDKILSDNISGLWQAIKLTYSNEEYFDSLIQWDDNWLITVLKKHYFKDYYNKKINISYMLEEFLSNKKNYFSIIKNNNDFVEFSSVFEKKLNLTTIKKKEEYKKIEKKYHQNCKNRKTHIIFAYLSSIYDEKIDIDKFLEKFIKEKYHDKVEDFFVVLKKIKTGLEREPMVHDSEKIFQLSNYSNIKNILETEKTNYPYFYIYIKLKKQEDFPKKEFLKNFGEFLSTKINELIKGVNGVEDEEK